MAHKAAEAALAHYFGYTSFRPAQEVPVASLLANKDVLAIMPTGAGKSICFQIPAIFKTRLDHCFFTVNILDARPGRTACACKKFPQLI